MTVAGFSVWACCRPKIDLAKLLCARPVFAYVRRVHRSSASCFAVRSARPLPRAGMRVVLCLLLLPGPLAAAAPATPAPSAALDWRVAEDQVSAQIDGWSLDRLLETVARVTRWQVYLDPAAEHVVNAKFRALPTGEALRRLLGPLNYALVPGTNEAPARLYVFRDARQAATVRIAVPEGATPPGRRIEEELIVTLPIGHPESIAAWAARLGATVVGRAEDLRAYRLRFDSAASAETARRELEAGGALVDFNYLVGRPDTAEVPLAGGGFDLGLKPPSAGSATGVIVAVVDTAVQGSAAGLEAFLLPAVSVAGPAAVPEDRLTHGTSMSAALLRGLASLGGVGTETPVRLLPVDVYGDRDSTTSFEMALGIQAAINGGANIVNLSLGGADPNPFVHRLIRAGRERGVVFLAAAGNAPVTDPIYPAAYPEVIAVTALNRRGEIAAYANRGEFVDVGAPGASVVVFQGQPYLVVGTSPATANAAAVAAYLATTRGWRGAELDAAVRTRLALESTAGQR